MHLVEQLKKQDLQVFECSTRKICMLVKENILEYSIKLEIKDSDNQEDIFIQVFHVPEINKDFVGIINYEDIEVENTFHEFELCYKT